MIGILIPHARRRDLSFQCFEAKFFVNQKAALPGGLSLEFLFTLKLLYFRPSTNFRRLVASWLLTETFESQLVHGARATAQIRMQCLSPPLV